MRVFRNILSQLHTFTLWLLFCAMFWSWIFANYINDTDRAHKITLYADVYTVDARDLTLRLEENLPKGIKMIKVSDVSFSGMIDNSAGDLYIIGETKLKQVMEEAPEALMPLSAAEGFAVPDGFEVFEHEGKCYGIRIYDPVTKTGTARQYIGYAQADSISDEAFYLCFDAHSIHLTGLEDAIDNAAWEVAVDFLTLRN